MVSDYLLSFHGAELDTADKVFLEDDEEYDEGDDVHDGGGHNEVCLPAVDGIKIEHADGKGAEVFAFDDDEGPEEASVISEEGEDGEDNEARAGEGQNDVPEDLPVGSAVDGGCFIEGGGNSEHELSEQEGAEGSEGYGDDEAEVGIEEVELNHDRKIGDHGNDAGDHEGGEIEFENVVASGPAEAGEGVSGKRAGEAGEEGDPCGDEEAVEVIARKRDVLVG